MSEDENGTLDDDWLAAIGGQDDAPSDPNADWEQAAQENNAEAAKEQTETAPFQELQKERSKTTDDNEDLNLDVILDVPVTISMEIGHTQINIRNLLQLNQGSVVELDRLAGEPMDVLVNGTLVAHGEVVVVNDKFGIRLTDVISPAERVRQLS